MIRWLKGLGLGLALALLGAGSPQASIFLLSGALSSSTPYPQLLDQEITTGVSASSLSVKLPTGITAGKLLIIMVRTSAGSYVNIPVGWASAVNDSNGPSLVVLYKVASGAEGATQTVTATAATYMTAISYLVGNYSGSPRGSYANGTSSKPNPPITNPGFGAVATLWIAGCTWVGGRVISSFPAGYGSNIWNDSIASGTNSTTAVTEDPGNFTISASVGWACVTFGTRGP